MSMGSSTTKQASATQRPSHPELADEQIVARVLAGNAVDSLPESYRVVFMLREIDGLDTAETALALNVSEDVVKTRLFRARAALRGRSKNWSARLGPRHSASMRPVVTGSLRA
jgi:RNA polymerase sigma factor (sigma-70 family)